MTGTEFWYIETDMEVASLMENAGRQMPAGAHLNRSAVECNSLSAVDDVLPDFELIPLIC